MTSELGEIADLPQKRPHELVAASAMGDSRRSPYTPVFHHPSPTSANGTSKGHLPLAVSTTAAAARASRPQSPAAVPALPASVPSSSRGSSPIAGGVPSPAGPRNTEADLRARLLTESKRLHASLSSSAAKSSSDSSSLPPSASGPPVVRLSMSENVKLAISRLVTSGLGPEHLGPLLALLTSVLEDAVGFEYAQMARDAAGSSSDANAAGGMARPELAAHFDRVLAAVDSLEQQLIVRLPRPPAKPAAPHPPAPPSAELPIPSAPAAAPPVFALAAPTPVPAPTSVSLPPSAAVAPMSRTVSQEREREEAREEARLRLREEKERARERDRMREREREADVPPYVPSYPAYDARPPVVVPPYRPLPPHRPLSPAREAYYPPAPPQPYYGAYGPPPPGAGLRYDDLDRRMQLPPRDLEEERRRDWEDRERLRYSALGRAPQRPRSRSPPGSRGSVKMNGGPPR